VSQILLNLCINANDALMGKPGRVTISLSRVVADAGTLAGDLGHGPRDELGVTRLASGTLKPGRGYAAIVVADTGVGMTADVTQQIFDPFFTTKERGQGTGLGLSVVHAIVMAHEGACSVSTRVGVGSVLAIYLPLADAAAVTEPDTSQTRKLAGRERVLIVDDEVMVADMLAIGLDRLGYEAVTLNDPDEALAIVTVNPSAWDVIVSDQVMPGMKGLTLFQGIRRVSTTLHMILCTGFSDGNTEEEAMALGIDAFFLKPVSPEQIAAAIRRIVDGHSDLMPIYRAQGQRH
jgi:CheY-like chemotaxis protein